MFVLLLCQRSLGVAYFLWANRVSGETLYAWCVFMCPGFEVVPARCKLRNISTFGPPNNEYDGLILKACPRGRNKLILKACPRGRNKGNASVESFYKSKLYFLRQYYGTCRFITWAGGEAKNKNEVSGFYTYIRIPCAVLATIRQALLDFSTSSVWLRHQRTYYYHNSEGVGRHSMWFRTAPPRQNCSLY